MAAGSPTDSGRREDECTRKKYTEIGSFAASNVGSVFAGGFAVPLCVAIGIGTAGVGGVACVVIAGAGLGFLGGSAGGALGELGELGGEQLYETFGD